MTVKIAVMKMSDCIEHEGSYFNHGYGVVHSGGRDLLAHRVAYEKFYGPINDGYYILHSCDNKRCVNVLHLRQGKQTENMRDMYERGRDNHPAGEDHGRAKLTWDDVRQIRAEGLNCYQTAEKWGIGKSQAHNILTGAQWKEKV